MQLLILVVVLCAVSLAEATSATPLQQPTWAVGMAIVAAVAVAGFAAAAVRVTLRAMPVGWQADDDSDEYLLARRALAQFGRLRWWHAVLWLASCGWVLLGLDWPRVVQANWGLGRFPLLDELVLLAPLVLPLVVSWGVFYEVDRRACPRSWQAPGAPPLGRIQYVGLHVRHYLVLALGPLVALLLVYDLARLLLDRAALDGPWGWGILVGVLTAIVAAFPWWVKWSWSARPLESGGLRDSLSALARVARVPLRDILLWPTGRRVANAAAVGLAGRSRFVLVSDGLIGRLSSDELAAVFCHELGHLRGRHLLRRAAALVLPVVAWLALPIAETDGSETTRWFAAGVGAEWPLAALAAPVAVSIYVVTAFAAYSRRLELEADWLAIETLVRAGYTADAAAAALDAALVKLLPADSGRTPLASFHPPLAQRRRYLDRWLHSPEAPRRFQANLRRCEWAAVLALGAALLARWAV